MESPQELRERLKKDHLILPERMPADHILYPAGSQLEIQIEQVVQLSRIAFRLIELERRITIIGEIIEEGQK